MDTLRWHYYELKRLWRLYISPEPSAKRLIKAVGVLWLWRHGARREFKVRLWQGSQGWYAIDLALPHLMLGVEADGEVHKGRKQQDIVRDQRLRDKGWVILRVTDQETRINPRKVKREVRHFLKGR